MSYIPFRAIAMASLLALSACGGGGGGGDGNGAPVTPIPKGDGSYRGQAFGSSSMVAAVLPDGSYWLMYTDNTSNLIGGVVQGSGTFSNGKFTAANGRQYVLNDTGVGAAGIYPVDVDANYVAKQSFDGKLLTENGRQLLFNSSYDPNYEAAPSLAPLADTYSGQGGVVTSTGKRAFDVTITLGASGALSGKAPGVGCDFSGQLSNGTAGNVYNLSVTFTGTGCTLRGATVTGVAYVDPSTKKVNAMGTLPDRSAAVMFTTTPAPKGDGVWIGKAFGSRDLVAAVLPDGSYWAMYLQAGSTRLGGVVIGQGLFDGSKFTDADGTQYNLTDPQGTIPAGIYTTGVDAAYTRKSSFNGNLLTQDGRQLPFTSSYDATYDETPNIAALASDYIGEGGLVLRTQQGVIARDFNSVNISFKANGDFTGRVEDNQCDFAGKVVAGTAGNVFSLNTTFSGTTCNLRGASVSGVVYFDKINNRLYGVATTPDKNAAVLFNTELLV